MERDAPRMSLLGTRHSPEVYHVLCISKHRLLLVIDHVSRSWKIKCEHLCHILTSENRG